MPNGGRAINRVAFTSLLATAMAVATFAGPAFSVLARFIIDELALTRGEFGWAVAAFSVVGAMASPAVGRLTDVVGGRKAITGVFAVGGLGLLAISVAPSYWWLIAASMLTGAAQASGNPGTNKLISVHIPEGRRGAVTGLKQSGVQAGVFLAGILLPAGALAWGWRPTVAIAGVLALLAIGLVNLVVPVDSVQEARSQTADRVAWSPPILWLTFYGALMGAAGGAVYTYTPLYGEEAVGLSVSVAGSVAGLAGLIAVFSRIWWARWSERRADYAGVLMVIAFFGVLFVGAMILATTAGAAFLWVGALGLGATATAWNSVGMLAVMAYAGTESAGGASGVVLLGFLSGFGLGPPIFGWAVDRFDSYGPSLWGALAVFLAAATVALIWRATSRTNPEPTQNAEVEPI